MRMFGLVVLLSGCGTVVPTSGSYEFGTVTTGNECFELTGFEGSTIRIDLDETSDRFDLVWTEDFAFDCELDGSTFVCDDEVFTSENQQVDATLTTQFSVSGEFVDEFTIDPLQVDLTYDCTGADCNDLEAQAGFEAPCTTDATTSATYIGVQ